MNQDLIYYQFLGILVNMTFRNLSNYHSTYFIILMFDVVRMIDIFYQKYIIFMQLEIT
jgi:hypothetical protein